MNTLNILAKHDVAELGHRSEYIALAKSIDENIDNLESIDDVYDCIIFFANQLYDWKYDQQKFIHVAREIYYSK